MSMSRDQNNSPNQNDPKDNIPVYSIADLSGAIKSALENGFGYVRVRGELSTVKLARSGHMYTGIKDENNVLDAVCWSGRVNKLSIPTPEEGMEVIATGKITTYSGRSTYQLIIEEMELAGEGALLKQIEERRKKLAAEGVFDDAHKRPLPLIPRLIGVVTSPTGAVIQDILHRLADRFPTDILLWPANVQGKGAVQDIITGIDGLNNLPDDGRPDVIIVARGGGSLEDLMAFNDEGVVRAVFNSDIPVISAVGHETDTTLIDYVADRRAPTPTAAAEMAVPVRHELVSRVDQLGIRLNTVIQSRLDGLSVHLTHLGRALPSPMRILESQAQSLDYLDDRLARLLDDMIGRRADRLSSLNSRLNIQPLRQQHTYAIDQLHRNGQALQKIMTGRLRDDMDQVEKLTQLLDSYSPDKVLERGYAYVTDDVGLPITTKGEAAGRSPLTIHFADGDLPVRPIDTPKGKKSRSKNKNKKSPAGPSSDNNQGSLFD